MTQLSPFHQEITAALLVSHKPAFEQTFPASDALFMRTRRIEGRCPYLR